MTHPTPTDLPEALRLADLLEALQSHMGPRRPNHPDDQLAWNGYTQAAAELRRQHAALSAAAPAAPAMAYLDIGIGGYTDVGTDLTEDQLAALPKGRHMLGIIGTYGIDGFQAAPQAQQPGAAHPIAPDIAADLERSDWTPEEALRWYAAGRHYDTVPNGDGTSSARILDNGAVASNALKSLSHSYAEHKGDVALMEAEQLGAAMESVLVDGVAYQTPAPVAGEMLRLHMDLLTATRAGAQAVPSDELDRRLHLCIVRHSALLQLLMPPQFPDERVIEAARKMADDAKQGLLSLLAAPAPAAASAVELEAARWREHVGKLDALVTHCPTCCQGFTAKPEMTRDEVIFECGKTAGRGESRALRQALELAFSHLEMDALRLSHCNDAAAIDAAMAAKGQEGGAA